MRITKSTLKNQITVINSRLGKEGKYNEKGALTLNEAYGGYAVHQYLGHDGAITSLTGGHGTAKETERFLCGYLDGLREANDNA